ncbi:uncharacterized protein C11orf98 homolog isoform X2 [Trachypithecus francoisi]|uniref:uncharacterized protein C11orf98 homolog isoform X2 n=1 Tax=Trachypithecus francoisi TaxID=54180 RepID=UPI00141B18D3|nr:uncharacterized protein C11orf98 homolog isoform X2 [Trachypithecus francoisi]
MEEPAGSRLSRSEIPGVPALEDRTSGWEAAGTEDMTPRGPEPFPSSSIHYGERYHKPDPRQEKEDPEASPRAFRPTPPPLPAAAPGCPSQATTTKNPTSSLTSVEKISRTAGLLYIAQGPAPELRLARRRPGRSHADPALSGSTHCDLAWHRGYGSSRGKDQPAPNGDCVGAATLFPEVSPSPFISQKS